MYKMNILIRSGILILVSDETLKSKLKEIDNYCKGK